MANPVIFKDLPATFPEKDEHKTSAAAGSITVHVILVALLVLVPLLLPEQLNHDRLLALIAPLAPPPPPPPPPAGVMLSSSAAPMRPHVVELAPDALLIPIVVPKQIAHVIDAPIGFEPGGVVGGVVGGVPGGVLGGVVGGVLGGILPAKVGEDVAPPPPPPPPPAAVVPPPPPPRVAEAAPIRIGGDVKEPKHVRIVSPVYPKIASLAHVHGTVVLEATLSAAGAVEEIRVISGHPLLVQAAIDAVKQWRYEPTLLNGRPVPVILTATVKFELSLPT
jgi:protein TonB